MIKVTAALKKAFGLIGTGTFVVSGIAIATNGNVLPVLCLGAGALMGLGIFMVVHTQEQMQ